MTFSTLFEDLGKKEYKETWDYQEQLFNQIIQKKLENRDKNSDSNPISNHLLFVEHPNVYTLGKSGEENNLLINDKFLQKINATYFKSNRGGDITYHGPGQIVGYPIFDLEPMNLSVKNYIHKLEDVIIKTIAEYGLVGTRLEGATGVWLDVGIPGKTRKICAIGVRASRYVSMHGFALNVNTNLDYFKYINPCGFVDKGVTSMERELGEKVNLDVIKTNLKGNFKKLFSLSWED